MTDKSMNVAMVALVDQMLKLVEVHERTNHGGEPCASTRASTAAYLAHHLGIRGRLLWQEVLSMAIIYERDCPCCQEERDDRTA